MPRSPSRVLAITIWARPDQISPSGATSSTRSVTALPHSPVVPRPGRGPALSVHRSLALQLLSLPLHVLDPAGHEERLLRDGIVLARGDCLERGDGLAERDEHPRLAGELLGDEHGVRQEPLDAPRPLDGDLVLFGQLIDAEDGDDVLQLLVPLQDPLHLAGHVVMLL